MANVRGTISNLFNGVSQQDDSLRLPNQGSVQENLYPSLVRGLVKRPPLNLISNIPSNISLPTNGQFHLVDRGGTDTTRERCFIHVSKSGITAIKPDGSLKSVHYEGNALSYLQAGPSNPTYAITTIADHTFISNCSVKTSISSATTAPNTRKNAVVYFKQAVYQCSYVVMVSFAKSGAPGSFTGTITYTTPSNIGDESSPPPEISTMKIAERIADSLNSVIQSAGASATVVRDGSFLFIRCTGNSYINDFTISDGRGDTTVGVTIDNVKTAAELPAKAIEGMVVKIVGTDASKDNDYYVRYKPIQENYNNFSHWEEVIGFSQKYFLESYTFPHILVDMGSHFVFKPASWKSRDTGDDITNPLPEFIGRPITGIFQYRNRLGLISEDIIALSEASEFFNYWRTTVMVLKDSDPIFITASINGAPTLRHAVSFNEDLVLFSDRAQYRLAAPDILSPATAAINVITQYRTDTDIPPVSAGSNIFFVNKELGNSAVYEYYIDSETGNKNAMCVTSHVPQYMPDSINNMSCSQALGLLVLHQTDTSALYLYKYYWAGNDKLQSAWFRFTFHNTIRIGGTAFIDDLLYILFKDASTGDWCMGSLNFSDTNPTQNYLDLTRQPFTSTYTFSRFYVRDKQNGGLPITAGRLQLQNCYINMASPSGSLTAKVDHLDGNQYEYKWTGFDIGLHNNLLGRPNLDKDYVFKFPVRSSSESVIITLTDDTWKPLTITSAAWEANYITKGVQLL